ncbi:hypothetical protein WR164_10240 [Philodulcilactobacillus myokoensis]|uniref:Uncharacterized protein n=1 Tax=Philodulcilactobacillus myokoensis TaxID=2929573 RepID=A0A9W6ESQ7_9LACO|nr:hypothetical protein [Philodulcilactobacillus myokoensis]GLB47045.1 hypothetical protein WR164_10240 [Philodulcilactobacillus myokoensis]
MDSSSQYTKLLNQLKDGQIKSLHITPDNFKQFQVAFMKFPTRKRIIGTAHQQGKITYVYQH